MRKAIKMKIMGIFLAIQSGLSRVCGPRSGGLIEIWFADAAKVTSFTQGSGNTWSAVTMATGSDVFYKFEFEQDTASRKNDGGGENGSTKVEHILEAYFGKTSQANRDRMQDILDSAVCGLICICKDANGDYWVEGYSQKYGKERPMRMPTVAVDSGKAFTDLNGQTLTLKSTDSELANTFTGSIPQ